MKARAAFVMVSYLSASALVLGQAPAQTQAPADKTPNIAGVVAEGTKVELIGANFEGASGTVPAPDGSLLLSNRDVNKITKIAADGTLSTYPVKVDLPNGIAMDQQGRLVAAQWTRPPQIGVIGDKTVVLANKFERRSFGGINDLAMDLKGGAYFTDHIDAVVYYAGPNGQVIKIDDTMVRPNGIILSPDGKVLYASDTQGPAIIAWDVQPDGSARNRREFAKLEGVRKTEAGFASGADGITVDGAGRLYVTANSGVQVFSPQGQYLGTIPVPKGRMQSVAFAGADKKTLYITGDNIVYKVAMQAEGFKGRPK